MDSVSRRHFMAASLAAASAMRVMGANDRIRMGVVGAGARGSYLIDQANRVGGIEWVAVSDAWDQRREESRKITNQNVELYADYRRLLDRKDIDAVIVATWDNNHTMVASDACRALKDVYVEKPMTSRPEQGPPMVRTVRETGRIVQVGVSSAALLGSKREIY
jgi:predicted dehydrogenase